MNYSLLVKENVYYPVTYIVKKNGNKIYKDTSLKGGDLTENQIKDLYFIGYFRKKPTLEEIEEYDKKIKIVFTHIWVTNFGWENTILISEDFEELEHLCTVEDNVKIFTGKQKDSLNRIILKGY
jgi:hypothetical protein